MYLTQSTLAQTTLEFRCVYLIQYDVEIILFICGAHVETQHVEKTREAI